MYFKARNGTFKRVPQMPNRFFEGAQGGTTVYYTSAGKGKTTAFKPVWHCPGRISQRLEANALRKGVPHALRRFHATHEEGIRDEVTKLLPLLHRPQLQGGQRVSLC